MASTGSRACLPRPWVRGARIYLCLTIACGGARHAVVPPSGGQCQLASPKTSLPAVEVDAAGSRFTLELDEVASRLEIIEGEPDARIEVLAPLRFNARAPASQLPLRVAEDTELFGGRIRLGKAAAPSWHGARGDGMLLSLERQLGFSVQEPLVIACSRLNLDNWRQPPPIPEPTTTGHEQVLLGCASFPLYVSPERADPIDVQYGGAVSVRERRAGWVHVAATWSDGSGFDGWIPEPSTEFSGASCGAIEGGVWDTAGRVASGVTLVSAVLRAGADVAASAGGPVWAHVTQDVAVELVAPAGSSEWVRVGTIPGLLPPWTTAHDHIWARARDVSLTR